MKPSPAGWVRGKNDYIALGSLLLCPRDGAEAQISDEISQRLRSSRTGYSYRMTSGFY